MPEKRLLTDQELSTIASQGGNPEDYRGKMMLVNTPEEDAAIDAQENQVGKGATVGRTLKAHAGGMAGGGAGFMVGANPALPWNAAAIAAAPETLGISLAVPFISGLVGGGVGGYAGQKAQDTVLGEETTEKLRKDYEQAEAQHPFVAGATDVAGNMLAGGMRPSLSNIPKAVRGLVTRKGAEMGAEELATLAANRQALGKVVGGAILNPAISTGVSLAQGQGIPSLGQLAKEAAGGALFSEQTKWGTRLTGHGGRVEEPTVEPTEKSVGGEVPDMVEKARTDGEVVPTKEVVAPAKEAKPITEAGETAEDLQKQLSEEIGHQAPKPTDYTEYTKLNNQLREMIKTGEHGKPEFKELWQKMEDIKNENGGMPPTEGQNAPAKQTETPEFKKWFGKSVLRDKEDKPLVVYHGTGTDADFTGFQTEGIKARGYTYGEGAYFTPDRERASAYSGVSNRDAERAVDSGTESTFTEVKSGNPSRVIPAFVKLEKPFVTSSDATVGDIGHNLNKNKTAEYVILAKEIAKKNGYDSWQAVSPVEVGNLWLRKQGYDGIIKEWNKGEPLEIVAFHPEQVKSAIGNRGTFNPNDPNITHSPDSPAFVKAPAQLDQHIINGKATVGSTLAHFANDETSVYSPLAKHILEIVPKEKLQAVMRMMDKNALKEGQRSHIVNSGKRINIHPDDITDGHVMMHEIGHAITLENLPREWEDVHGAELKKAMDNYLTDTKGHAGIKELIQSYYQAAKQLEMHDYLFTDKKVKKVNPDGTVKTLYSFATAGDPELTQEMGKHFGMGGTAGYGMGNLHEFITMALTNKDFQQHLDAMPSGIEGKSMWTRIVDAIKSILGVNVKEGSLLERALRATDEVIKTPSERNMVDREAGGIFNAPAKAMDERDTTRQSIIKGWAATFDKVRAKSVGLADAFQRERATRDSIQALGTTALDDLSKLPHNVITKVFADHRANVRDDVPLPKYTGAAKQASDILNRYYVKEIGQLKQEGPKINDRLAHITPNWVSDAMNDKWVDLLTKNPTSAEAQHGLRAWADHVVKESNGGITKKEALDNINNYVEAMGGERNNYRTLEFGAVRKAAGFGLPEGMRETDPVKAIAKYSPRVAADLAFFKEIQNRPEISGSLKIKDEDGILHTDDPRANPSLAADRDVKDAMKWITGNYGSAIGKNSPHLAALSRAYNNSIMGPATGIRNTLQVPIMAIPYIHDMGSLKAFFTGAMKFREESRAALESGARIPQIDKIVFDTIKDSPDIVVSLLNKFATMARKWQGREWLENFDRNVTFAAGKELAKYNIIGALKGNKNSIKFLEKFGLNVEGDITKLAGADLEKALNQIGKNFTDRNQGTYGGAGLALGVVDSPLAPFLALQKWSIEKQNVIFQDVIKPFLSGENHLPLITYTLGSVLTGAVIQELNKVLTGRKAQDPELKEALGYRDAKGNVSPVALVSELASLMQLSSFSGMVGDALKATSDMALHGKTPRNIVSYPLLTGVADVGTKTKDMMEALRQGEDPWAVWKEYSLDLLTHNIQSLRMLSNYTVDKQELEKSDKFRDVRVFNELEGKPAKDYPTTNPYLGLDAKSFKKEQDPAAAMALLPGLLKKALTDAKGDPFVLKQKLQALKANNYQSMPNMENMPLSFMRYLNYLKATQGEDAAQARMMDYLKVNAINKIKSSVVPSL